MAGAETNRDRIFNVLFLCTGNSARSIMAEAILNREGLGRFRAFSAGSHPTGTVNPRALHALKVANYLTDDLRSKDWDEFSEGTKDAPEFDFVFTVCDDAAGEVCPIWPGQPMTAHWGLPDPAAATGSEAEIAAAFANAFRMLYDRISILISLPMATLDTASLQREIERIGTNVPEKENA